MKTHLDILRNFWQIILTNRESVYYIKMLYGKFKICIAGLMPKYFIHSNSRLIAVLKPHTDISSEAINTVLAMQ